MTIQPQKRSHYTCHRHPTKPITGFCASCLRERLAGMDPDSHQELPSVTPFGAELRRSKSCSGANRDASSAVTAPQPRRKSCDVKARNTLSELFDKDDQQKIERGNLGLDLREEDEERDEREGETRVCENGSEEIANADVVRVGFDDFEEDADLKTMKEFIDLEWQSKKNTVKDFRDIASTFWEAASVFSRKLRKWRKKEKMKRSREFSGRGNGAGEQSVRDLTETQSKVGEYGLGRRSCDTDPRVSVDNGRMSLDGALCSFDEPRASWDGILIGRSYPRFSPMVSVFEDLRNPVALSKNLGSVEENPNSMNEEELDSASGDEKNPGGSAQTRDYYGEPLCSQRRRRSFDRSISNRRMGLVEVDEVKSMSNAKVSPETDGLFHGAKLLITEKDLRESNWYSYKEYRSEAVEAASKDLPPVDGINPHKGFKKLHRWGKIWNLKSLMQRKSDGKCGEREKCVNGNVIDQTLEETCKQKPKVANGEGNGAISEKLIRSYTVSSRKSCSSLDELSESMGRTEALGNCVRRREDLMLHRNKSARYSPRNHDNGLLRFYLTPLRSSRRSKTGSKPRESHSLARNVL